MASTDVHSRISVAEKLPKEQVPIQGTCMMMCPNSELRLRQREALVHPLEFKINAKGQRLGFSDPKRMVKEFHRSSAGQKILPSDVRPLPILKRTVSYLLSGVCNFEDVSWREIYDFVNDRLRAVRQDITVQDCKGKKVIEVLAPAARFYVYAQYRLCEYGTSEFDPHLNMIQLNEILLTILTTYRDSNCAIETEEIDFDAIYKAKISSPERSISEEVDAPQNESCSDILSSLQNCHINDSNSSDETILENTGNPINELSPYTNVRCTEFWSDKSEIDATDTRVSTAKDSTTLTKYTIIEEMIALYLLIKIGNPQEVAWVLEMPKSIRNRPLLFKVIEASINWMAGNHVPLVKLSYNLTPILALALHMHWNRIQRHALGVLSVAHSSKVLNYSIVDLKRHLLFSTEECVKKTCHYYGLDTTEEGVQFLKTKFKWDVPVLSSQKSEWIESRLKDFTLSDLFFPDPKT